MSISLRAMMACSLVLAGFAATFPQLTESSARDLWNRLNREAPPRHGQTELALEGVKNSQERQEFRYMVVTELIEQRISLSDAIDHFYELNQSEPEIMVQARRRFPAETDQLTVGLQVLGHVEAALQAEPSRRKEVVGRLKLEFIAIEKAESAATH